MPATRAWNNGSVDTSLKNPVAFALSTVPTHKTTNIMRPLSHAFRALQWVRCVGTGSAAERGLLRSGRCFEMVTAKGSNRLGIQRKAAVVTRWGRRQIGPLLARKGWGQLVEHVTTVLSGVAARHHLKTSSYVRARIDTAHGPAWAAPTKHRMPRKGKPESSGAQGAGSSGRPAKATNESSKAEVRDAGTCVRYSQSLKPSDFDEHDSGIAVSKARDSRVQPTPANGGPMKKRKRTVVDWRAKKASRAIKFEGKSVNEISDMLRASCEDFLLSTAWRELRAKVVSHYGAKCMKCGAIPKSGINVDHIKPRLTHPHLALEFDNLQVLCWRCNKAKGNAHETDYRSLGRTMEKRN